MAAARVEAKVVKLAVWSEEKKVAMSVVLRAVLRAEEKV